MITSTLAELQKKEIHIEWINYAKGKSHIDMCMSQTACGIDLTLRENYTRDISASRPLCKRCLRTKDEYFQSIISEAPNKALNLTKTAD